MTTSPRLGFTYLADNQAAPETAVNEIAAILESAAGHFIFKDRDLATPPGSPANGDCYLIAASATDAWAGQDGNIAFRLNTGWLFITPTEGFTAWVNDEDVFIGFDGTSWSTLSALSAAVLTAANNLSDVADAATAWTNIGGGTSGKLDVDTDTTLAADSDTVIPSQAAVKAYVDANAGGTGGGTGSAWNLQFGPLQNEAPSTNFATLDSRNGHPVLDFDDTTAESAVFTLIMPGDYSGAGITASLWWTATSATSGNVMWQASLEAMSGQDIDSDGFATAQAFAASACNATSGILTKVSLNISDGANMDTLAAGGAFRLKITRDASNVSDTMTGDAELLRVMVVSQ